MPIRMDCGWMRSTIPARLFNQAKTTNGIIWLPFMQHLSEALPARYANLQPVYEQTKRIDER